MMINIKYLTSYVFLVVFLSHTPAFGQQKTADKNSHGWNLKVKGFSPAYFDQQRNAIAINTLEHDPEKWAAATKKFDQKTGVYTLKFTSLQETDGESVYVLKINGKKVLEFTNPRIFGKNVDEYFPHTVTVNDVKIRKGSLIQVEFLADSNGLVEEGDGFAFARARWAINPEFILQ
jgi:hypothetical protein